MHDEILRRCDDSELLKQISKDEISGLINFILHPEQQSRIAALPIGICTRFDKYTLARSNRGTKSLLLALDMHNKKQLKIPRTIIAMRESETVITVYILLGTKLSGAVTKDPSLKISGAFKHKTNVLKISFSDNFNNIDVSVKAMLKIKKNIENYMYGLKKSLCGAKIQYNLAQKCPEILNCTPLVLDETFSDSDLYIVSDLGVDLHSVVAEKQLQNPEDKKIIIKDICKALCFLHRLKFSHRDVKMENVIINPSKRAKFIDFDFTDVAGEAESKSGTFELLPYYFLGGPKGKKLRRSYFIVSNLVLDETEKNALYRSCCVGENLCDIWAFGIVLYEIYNGENIDTCVGVSTIYSYKNSKNIVEQLIYQILCPDKKDCYLLATKEQLEEDIKKPLLERTYLSMEKIYYMLFREEYTLNVEVEEDLQTRVRDLIKSRPKLLQH